MNLKDTVAGFGVTMLKAEMEGVLATLTACKEIQDDLAKIRLSLKVLKTKIAGIEDDLPVGVLAAVQAALNALPLQVFKKQRDEL